MNETVSKGFKLDAYLVGTFLTWMMSCVNGGWGGTVEIQDNVVKWVSSAFNLGIFGRSWTKNADEIESVTTGKYFNFIIFPAKCVQFNFKDGTSKKISFRFSGTTDKKDNTQLVAALEAVGIKTDLVT